MAHAPFPAGRWRHAPFPPVGGIIGARTVPSRWRDQQCGGNSASRWRRCCGCSASRWRLSASHWRRGRWRLPPRQQWRWHSGGRPGASACQSHSPVPDVLGGGIPPMHSPATIPETFLFDKQHGQTLDLGFGRDWSSQPLAVSFLPAVGSSLPWHGQLWRRTPTLMGHSQGWLGTATDTSFVRKGKSPPGVGVGGVGLGAGVGVWA